VALALQDLLMKNDLVSQSSPSYSFLVSDYTESFEASTQLFFKHKVSLEKLNLWS
jgi:hypothetical protein